MPKIISIGTKEFARLYSAWEIKIAKRIWKKNNKDKLRRENDRFYQRGYFH